MNLSNNRIHGLNINGTWSSNPDIIKEEVASFFWNKFKEPVRNRPSFLCSNFNKLENEDDIYLEAGFSAKEIKEAVWSLNGDKSPGPDGYNFNFIKKWWSLFEDDFLNLFNEFHKTGRFSKGVISCFIALIPKVKDPISLSEYRPICLIGIINKVVSKVLANRLKMVLPKLITEEQMAYCSGKSILDGPLILNEIVNDMKRKKRKGLVVKVDIEKAFDSLNWNFLDSVLSQMGFGSKWRSWIKAIIETPAVSVLVNGCPTKEFKCSRGIRQGDPLSPFLFILAMETLSAFMKKAAVVGTFQPWKGNVNGVPISHLLFADDAVFVGEWTTANVLNLKRILRCFHLVSGLKINLKKSQLFGVQVDNNEVVNMAATFGCDRGSFPLKYLGLMVGANMNISKNWEPVIETFKKRLAPWKAKSISFGGRITLTKAVLNSLPTYYLSLYKVPSGVINELDKIRRRFIWGGDDGSKKISWVNWGMVTDSIENGGLGIGCLKLFNQALLSKWWWRFKTETNSLWKKVVWDVHHTSSNWSSIPGRISNGGLWIEIVKTKYRLADFGIQLENCLRSVLGNGLKLLFWLDIWITPQPLSDLLPNLFKLEANKLCRVADRVGSNGNSLDGVWDWKRLPSTDEEANELFLLADIIAKASLTNSPDRWKWELDKEGDFSVKSIRQKVALNNHNPNVFVLEWNNWVPKKVNTFVWRAIMGRIPTKDALLARKISLGSDVCSLCGEGIETAYHIFISCEKVQRIWQFLSYWLKTPPIYAFETKDLMNSEWLKGKHKVERKAAQAILMTTMWEIWLARNQSTFESKATTSVGIIEAIKSKSFLWVKNRAKKELLGWEDWLKFKVV